MNERGKEKRDGARNQDNSRNNSSATSSIHRSIRDSRALNFLFAFYLFIFFYFLRLSLRLAQRKNWSHWYWRISVFRIRVRAPLPFPTNSPRFFDFPPRTRRIVSAFRHRIKDYTRGTAPHRAGSACVVRRGRAAAGRKKIQSRRFRGSLFIDVRLRLSGGIIYGFRGRANY